MFADRLISRNKWQAKPARTVVEAPLASGQQIHWTAVPGAEALHWPSCYDQVKGIQNYHMNTRGWYDIGYNFLVCNHGFVFEGRGWGVQPSAAGTRDGNWNYLAIAAIAGEDDAINNNFIRAIQDIVLAHDGGDVQKPHSWFKSTTCPGPRLTALTNEGAFKRQDVTPPIPLPDPLVKTAVLGLPQATQLQAIAYAKARAAAKGSTYTDGEIQKIVETYYEWGAVYGVRPDLAIAMSAKETGYWSYGGDVQADQWNFAGIGATGGVPGISFLSIEAGVKAHLLRMRMYASADGSFYDEDVLVRPLPSSHWGKYPTIQDFDGVWAVPGIGYGDSIVDSYLDVMLLTPEPVPEPAPVPLTLEQRVTRLEGFH